LAFCLVLGLSVTVTYTVGFKIGGINNLLLG
jgi:hypothetical protein